MTTNLERSTGISIEIKFRREPQEGGYMVVYFFNVTRDSSHGMRGKSAVSIHGVAECIRTSNDSLKIHVVLMAGSRIWE